MTTQIARDVIGTLLGEAASGTRAERYADMLNIASTIANRAALTGVTPADIVSARGQYSAYGKHLPAGTEAYRDLAEQAWDQVQTSGPVISATYYATPAAASNLPSDLTPVSSTTGHDFFSDPAGRAISTARGYVRPNPSQASFAAPVSAPSAAPAISSAAAPASTAGLGMMALAPEMTASTRIGPNISYAHPERGLWSAGLTDPAVQAATMMAANLPGGLGITSARRTPSENARAGGAKRSQHMLGNAFDVDLANMDEQQRANTVEAARMAGAKRLGAYSALPNMLHVDFANDYAPTTGGVYAMMDESARNMARAPGWFVQGLGQVSVPTPTARPDPASLDTVAGVAPLNSFAALAGAGPITSAPLGAASFSPTAPAVAPGPMATAPLASLLSQAGLAAAPAAALGAPERGIMRSLDPGVVAPDVSRPDAFGWVQPSTAGQVMAPGVTPTGQFSTAGLADRLSTPAAPSLSSMAPMGDRVSGLGDMAPMGDRVAPMSMPSPERMALSAPPSLSISAPVTPAAGFAVAQDPSTMTAFGGVPSPSRPDNRPAPVGTGLAPKAAVSPVTVASVPAAMPSIISVVHPSLLAPPVSPLGIPSLAKPAARPAMRAAPQTVARASVPSISRPTATAGDVYSGLANSGVASDGSKVSRNDQGGVSITNSYGVTTTNNAAGQSLANWSGTGPSISSPSSTKSSTTIGAPTSGFGSKLGMVAGGLLGGAAAGPVGALAGGYLGGKLGPTAEAPGRPASGFAGSPWSGGILGGLAGGLVGGPIGLGLGAWAGSRITSGVGFGPNAFMGAFPSAPAAPSNPGGGGWNAGILSSLSPGERASVTSGAGGLY